MKNRFTRKKNTADRRNFLISLLFFAFIFSAFWFGISSISEKTEEKELVTLEKAVARGITYCYAMEGSYPNSLSYLKENYGLIYDENKYFIDYQPLGANIVPDVTIIRKKDR
ncbi:MAG: hypothetical protein HFI82_11670 [Eubacterium sp.]|jgi:hypothetical protein|nr:hypothetical protein [Eubacterium sp.]